MKKVVLLIIINVTYFCFISCKKVQVITKKIRTKDNIEMTLTNTWNKKLTTYRYGKTIKKNPLPFIFSNNIVFNTTKGCIIFSLNKKKIIKFYDGLRYVSKDLSSKIMYLMTKKHLYSISITKNSINWKIKIPQYSFSTAICNRRLVLLLNEQLKMLAVRAEDGEILWKRNKGASIILQKNTYPKNEILDKKYYSYILPSRNTSNPILTQESVVVGTKNGYLLSFNINTGKKQWQTKLKKPGNGKIVTNYNHIFLGTSTGVIVINNKNGLEKKYILMGKILEKSASNNRVEVIKKPRITCMIKSKNILYTYSAIGSIISSINTKTLEVNWSITHRYTGVCGCKYFVGMSIALDRLWVAPLGPLHNNFFQGIDIKHFEYPIIRFSKEKVRNLQDKELMIYGNKHARWHYYKKLPFLEWNNQLILVDEKDITAYKIIPKYKKVGNQWVENK